MAMQEIHFSDSKASSMICALFKASNLIPFFGSGFTKGFRTKNGKIPDANQLIEHIKSTAVSKPGCSASDMDQINSITQLKVAFGLLSMEEYISSVQAQALLGNIFSNTQISDKSKNDLINLDWPHLFTFNVDDAIENVTRRYEVLQPNRKFSREFIDTHACLFKIHGDISEFIKYKDPNLIFTWREYAHSIESNKAMLSFLEEEAKNSAFLFIGCSLDAEIDLLHLSRNTPFARSIFLKKGKLNLSEKITIAAYGIETVIYFDTYDEICTWIVDSLKGVTRKAPYRGLRFDDSTLTSDEAINIIANGGPLSHLNEGSRVARLSQSFASRTAISIAMRKLREHECVLITGRRFSGKTLFLFQLISSLKEYSTTFYGSTDIFDPSILKLLNGLDNNIFVFDSNYLNVQALDEVLHAKMHSGNRLVICSSFGDAELFRFRLAARNVDFQELTLQPVLDSSELQAFNKLLAASGLPLYSNSENLLTFAYRYYREFKSRLGRSTLFSLDFDRNAFSIMILIAAFGKAESKHIHCFNEYFDVDKFIKSNDRLFEKETTSAGGGYIVICNSLAWLLKILGEFIYKDITAEKIMADVIESLSRAGFTGASQNLISFDKLNELGDGNNVHKFIRNVYIKISETYQNDMHYWLQRAKSELISSNSIDELNDGMRYASKVRLDSELLKNQTYYSATLVMAQLQAKAYRFNNNLNYLLGFLDYCLESIRNHKNNRRHIDKLANQRNSDVAYTLNDLRQISLIELLPRKSDIDELLSFFRI